MKFKLIFLLFNVLILISFGIVVFMPFIMLGAEYSSTFWSSSWYLPALFLLIIIAIDSYFLLNWKLFTLLEAENWSGLLNYLENKVLQQHSLRSTNVRSLIHSYFVTGNISKIEPLEQLLREKRPSLLKKYALEIGMPKVLNKDHEDMVRFFDEFRKQNVPNQAWIRFLHAFGLLMEKEHSEGREELLDLSHSVKEPILKILLIYTLDPFRSMDNEVLERVDAVKEELKAKFGKADFEKEIEKSKSNIAVVVMNPLINDAIKWMYEGE